MCVNEFKDVEFDQENENEAMFKNGNEVLKYFNYENVTANEAMLRLAKLLAFNYWITYHILKSRKPRFLKFSQQKKY